MEIVGGSIKSIKGALPTTVFDGDGCSLPSLASSSSTSVPTLLDSEIKGVAESASIGEGSQGSEEEMDANAVGPASSTAETPVEAAADDEEDEATPALASSEAGPRLRHTLPPLPP